MSPDTISDCLADAVRRLDTAAERIPLNYNGGLDAAFAVAEVQSVITDLGELKLAIEREQISVIAATPRIVSVEPIEGSIETFRVTSTITLGFLRLVRDASGHPDRWIARSTGDPGGQNAGTIRRFPPNDRDAAVAWLLASERVSTGRRTAA